MDVHGIDAFVNSRELSGNYVQMMQDIDRVITLTASDGRVQRLPVFVRRNEYRIVKGSLQYLLDKTGKDDMPQLLYLEDLVVCLRDKAGVHLRKTAFFADGELTVHQGTLMEKSSYFRGLIEGNFSERTTRSANMTNVCSKYTMAIFLRYFKCLRDARMFAWFFWYNKTLLSLLSLGWPRLNPPGRPRIRSDLTNWACRHQ